MNRRSHLAALAQRTLDASRRRTPAAPCAAWHDPGRRGFVKGGTKGGAA